MCVTVTHKTINQTAILRLPFEEEEEKKNTNSNVLGYDYMAMNYVHTFTLAAVPGCFVLFFSKF